MLKVSKVLVFYLAIALLIPGLVSAETVNTAIGKVDTDPEKLVSTILRFALGIAGGVAFLLIIYGGFKLAFAQGNPENVQAGREMITSAIVGLLIIIFSVFLLNLIGIEILGLPLNE